MKSVRRVLFIRYAGVSIAVTLIIGLLIIEVRSEIARWLFLIIGLAVLLVLLLLVTYWTGMTLNSGLGEIGRSLEKMVVDNNIYSMPQPRLLELKSLAESLDTIASRVRRNFNLLESERDKFKAVLDNVNAAVMLFSANGKAELINSVAGSLLGVEAEYAVGRTITEINPSIGLDRVYELASSGENVDMEVGIFTPENRILQVIAGPVITDKGGFRGTIVILNDITATRHLETVRKDFVANVSHELRTPVANLRAVTDALMTGGIEDRERAIAFLENIDRESSRLMRIIEDLLVLSRMERDRVSMVNEPVAINELLGEVVAEESDHAKLFDVEIIFNEARADAVVRGDSRLLKTALVNLVANAIKYNRPGGRVIIDIDPHDDYVEVSVKDTGVGIPANDIERIFERFYRVDRARSRETGGTGLGLSIVKHAAELHGGMITVESTEGEGSHFLLVIPL